MPVACMLAGRGMWMTVKVSRPIANWARGQTVGSQLGRATATEPGVRTAGWGSLSTGSPAGLQKAVSPGATWPRRSAQCTVRPL